MCGLVSATLLPPVAAPFYVPPASVWCVPVSHFSCLTGMSCYLTVAPVFSSLMAAMATVVDELECRLCVLGEMSVRGLCHFLFLSFKKKFFF